MKKTKQAAPALVPWTPKQWEDLFHEMIRAAGPKPKGRPIPHPILWDGARWVMWLWDVTNNGGISRERFV